ncbi:Cytochrome P450 85A [Linum perenne]
MDPELNRYILYNESKGLVPGYPKAMVDILGTNISSVHGATHKHIRGSILTLIGPNSVKDNLFPSILRNARIFVSDWDGTTLDIQDKTKEVHRKILCKIEMILIPCREPLHRSQYCDVPFWSYRWCSS